MNRIINMKKFIMTVVIVGMLLTIEATALAISPDIKANNSDGPVAIGTDDTLSATISLDTEGTPVNADWWVVLSTPFGWYYLDATMLWKSAGSSLDGLSATYQGGLLDISSFSILNMPGLSTGIYIFYFVIDTNMNGNLDLGQSYYDSVKVNVYVTQDDIQDGGPYVDIYDPTKACGGTTIFSDAHDSQNPRIIEVNMLGQIVWEYDIPDELIQNNFIGLDVEVLSNDNILYNLSNSGIYEIDRDGNTVWSYSDGKNSHDADRLSNGNTIYVYGNDDTIDDAQIKEVSSSGELVYEWFAKDEYDIDTYNSISRQGWTHANAVTRLSSGNTLISLRNFDLTIEVDPSGSTVWSFDWRTLGGSITDPHEPEIQPNDNLLVCMQRESPYRAVEINRTTGEVVWSYSDDDLRTARDCDRLPNGNTLIVAVLENGTKTDLSDDESVIFEVTSAGEIVWKLRLKNSPIGSSPGVFYKAQRDCGN